MDSIKCAAAILEFNDFCYAEEEWICTTADFDCEKTFNCNVIDVVFIVNVEYVICGKYELNRAHIHYDDKNEGSERFQMWMKKYHLRLEWYNDCYCFLYSDDSDAVSDDDKSD